MTLSGALVGELDGARVAQLVRGKAPAHAGAGGKPAHHRARGGGCQGRPRVGPLMTQNSGPTGRVRRTVSHGASTSIGSTPANQGDNPVTGNFADGTPTTTQADQSRQSCTGRITPGTAACAMSSSAVEEPQ